MKKIKKGYYNVEEYVKQNNLEHMEYEESLYLYVKYLCDFPKHKNTLISVLPYDYSLQLDDLVTEMYLRALNHKNKDYVYSIFSYTFDLNKICRHYKSTKKGMSEEVSMQEYFEPHVVDDYRFIYEDLLSNLSDEDKKIITMYVVHKYTLEEISQVVDGLNSKASVKFRINSILKKIKATL